MTFTGDDIKIIESYGIKVLANNCQANAAKDKSLPSTTYLVRCQQEDAIWYDIVMGSQYDIFDAYYDTFGDVIKSMKWTEGRINPKLWGIKPKSEKKKR
jgi:hypothetical protein